MDTSTVRSANADGVLEGLTGRKLAIPATWANPSGRYHLGVKNIYDMYSAGLRARIRAERKEQLWDAQHSLALADAHRQLVEGQDDEGQSDKIRSLADKWRREDLAAKVDLLKAAATAYEDLGPVADLVAFYDGKSWRVCLDTSFRGRLAECALLAPFKESHEYGTVTAADLMTYTVNVHRKGNLIELCTTSSPHGTHVAGIAAAHFPDAPAKNGIAPGAQLVAMKISDCRTGSMETGRAFIRALHKCVEMGVAVVNYSFGEPSHLPNRGEMVEQLRKVVERWVEQISQRHSGNIAGTA